MQNNVQPKNKKALALAQVEKARSNLILMIVLTAVNVAMLLFGSDYMLLFSATVPYFSVIFGTAVEGGLAVGIAIAAIILGLYILCWIFSKKYYGFMIAALVLFVLDTLVMALVYLGISEISGVLDVIIHIWVLYYLVIGVTGGYKLKHLSPEEELEYEAAQASIEPEETEQVYVADGVINASSPIRVADTSVKSRTLIEGDFVGKNIVYRRVKRVNELVINGNVYDEVKMLVETAHSLTANLDGHQIEVGYDGIINSYIKIDGERVAKKIRIV